jgi:flavin reductase (NADH)
MTMSRPRAGAPAVPEAAEAYRQFMRVFPTGVAVVTAVDRIGRPHGLTCTSLTSVSMQPPTLLVCLDQHSGTLAAVSDHGAFAVNLLHDRARRTAELFASRTPDRFGQVSWHASDTVGAPWLTADAFAVAECRVMRMVPVADHVVIMGEVVRTVQSGGLPLLYGLRRFTSWPHDNGTEVDGCDSGNR